MARAHRVGILVFDGLTMLDVSGPAEVLGTAHRFDASYEVVLVSPYLRAQATADLIAAAGGLTQNSAPRVVDERLREREFGILDRLTSSGIRELHPEQAELRRAIGKFYHRPPGGESWCDVILRLRSALDTLSLHHAGQRVLIVSHQVVVLCLRYLIECMTEEEILAIDRSGDVANCSVTEYRVDLGEGQNGALKLQLFADEFDSDICHAGCIAPRTSKRCDEAGTKGRRPAGEDYGYRALRLFRSA